MHTGAYNGADAPAVMPLQFTSSGRRRKPTAVAVEAAAEGAFEEEGGSGKEVSVVIMCKCVCM